jgi:DMSO/TMAO reductase YedYZ molybdopterin-dependent catalytic subunit
MYFKYKQFGFFRVLIVDSIIESMKKLPPGQKESNIFPRFGLPQYANRIPKEVDKIKISIGGDLDEFEITKGIESLTRVDQVSDFHCVTTWSHLNCNWSGYKFEEFYTKLIVPKLSQDISFVVMKGHDGYKTSLPLLDLLEQNVLLADRLDDTALTIEHGAPIRIVAPDHYGYKNLKHIYRLEFYTEAQAVKQGYLSFMDHPRARVAHEERATMGPGIFFRLLYKFGIKGTIRDFEKATQEYNAKLASKEAK